MVQKPKRRRLSLNCWHFSVIWDRDMRFPPNESRNILVFVSFMPCVIILWNHVWKPQLLSCQTFFSWKILQISSLPIPTAGDPNSWCFWLFLDQFWHNICLKIYVRKSWVKLLKFLQPRANSMPSTKQWRVLDAASEGTISKTVGSDADSTAFAIDCSYHIRKIESVLTLLKPWW